MEKYQIRIHGIFESAHYLYEYYPDGRDEELHGHTWEAELFVESTTLKKGISVDFLEIRQVFDQLMEDLDHILLNDMEEFKAENPTAEHLARYIFMKCRNIVREPSRISEIKVWEGPKNYASYFPK